MEEKIPVGQKLSPILGEIEDVLWEHDANLGTPPKYTIEGFRGAIKIFSHAMFDAAYARMRLKKMSPEEAEAEATALGDEIRQLVLKYTGIDSVKLYEEPKDE